MEHSGDNIHQGKLLKNYLKGQGCEMQQVAAALAMTRQNLNYHLRKEKLEAAFYELVEEKLNITLQQLRADRTYTTGEDIRLHKAIGNNEPQGMKYVPVKAQAGYSLRHNDPLYISDLRDFNIPGNPYAGDNFRAFEVSGDSMEYYDEQGHVSGLSGGMLVIGERIDPDYWDQTVQYYVHVIVTDDRIMVKRLFRKGDWFACISDNEQYEQFKLNKTEIKELWLVKRKIDWDMPPPRKIEIKIDLP